LTRARYVIILLALAAANARAQEAEKVCSDGRTIKIASQWGQLAVTLSESELAAQPLRYSISRTQDVLGAWVEVWDRPKRLSREAVAITREGEASCTHCQDAEQTAEELYISIFDPGVLSFFTDGDAPPTSGDYVSEVLVGKKPEEESDESDEPAYLMGWPSLTGDPIRIVEGSPSTSVVLSGEDLAPSSRVYLKISEDASPSSNASRDYLYSRTVDLRHVQVTISSYLLRKPGVLTAYAKDSWQGREAEGSRNGQKIIVASKDSPVIDSVDPPVLRCRGLAATVVLRGSGFTEHSEVKFGDNISLGPDVTFVSPTELRVGIPADELEVDAFRYFRATPLTLSVTNDPLHFSAPVTVRVLPSAKFKLQPLAAVLRAISPYPVPMMDFHSPPVSYSRNQWRQLSPQRRRCIWKRRPYPSEDAIRLLPSPQSVVAARIVAQTPPKLSPRSPNVSRLLRGRGICRIVGMMLKSCPVRSTMCPDLSPAPSKTPAAPILPR